MGLGMMDGFAGQVPQSKGDIEAAMRSGLVSLDANVLLNFYRFSPNSRNALAEVIRALGDRAWVSHQAAREFWRNRLSALDDRNSATRQFVEEIAKARRAAEPAVNAWAKRTAASEEIVGRLRDELGSGFDGAIEVAQTETSDSERVSYDADSDSVLQLLLGLLHGKIGGPMDQDTWEDCLNEAKRRSQQDEPPGYLDSAKNDSSLPEGGAGDYLVWRQSMDEARSRGLPLVIVTGDEKDDWWWKHKGVLLGPRPELTDEFNRLSGCALTLLRPVQLIQHAGVLDVTVDDSVAADIERATSTPIPRWTAEAVEELLRRLDAEGAVQAAVIRRAAQLGGVIDREELFEVAGYEPDRMLRGFTRPAKRITRDLQDEGLLDEGVEDILTPLYLGVIAEQFEIPLDVVEILSGGMST